MANLLFFDKISLFSGSNSMFFLLLNKICISPWQKNSLFLPKFYISIKNFYFQANSKNKKKAKCFFKEKKRKIEKSKMKNKKKQQKLKKKNSLEKLPSFVSFLHFCCPKPPSMLHCDPYVIIIGFVIPM